MAPLFRLNLKGTVGHLQFYRRVLGVLAKYGLEEFVAAVGEHLHLGRKELRGQGASAVTGRTRPERVRMALEELGPTFVKLGQLLSTRPDLIPPEYCAELERLQDHVVPVRYELIRPEVERELGGKIEEKFREFDPRAFAAGSIAQLHRAVTRDGREVAVKVRRPGVESKIRSECEMLERLAGLVKNRIGQGDSIDPVLVAREFTRAVLKEVDLANERRNIRRFQISFKDDPAVHVPAVHDDYCTRGVLTMEYIRGVKPTDAEAVRKAGLDPRAIAQRGVDFVLRQVLEFGFFQADPHPGNFFVMEGNVLAPVDFGQVARLGEPERVLMGEFLHSVLEADSARLVRALERLDMTDERCNLAELERDLDDLLGMYRDLPVKEMPFGAMVRQTFDIFRRHHLRPPAEFTLMLKAMMTVESMAVALDSDFRLVDRLQPYARRAELWRMSPRRMWRSARQSLLEALLLAGDLPGEFRAILRNVKRGRVMVHVHHEHLENLAHTLDKSSDRVSFALIIAGLLVGSSLLVAQKDTVLLGLVELQTLGVLGYLVAAVLGIGLLISIVRRRKE